MIKYIARSLAVVLLAFGIVTGAKINKDKNNSAEYELESSENDIVKFELDTPENILKTHLEEINKKVDEVTSLNLSSSELLDIVLSERMAPIYWYEPFEKGALFIKSNDPYFLAFISREDYMDTIVNKYESIDLKDVDDRELIQNYYLEIILALIAMDASDSEVSKISLIIDKKEGSKDERYYYNKNVFYELMNYYNEWINSFYKLINNDHPSIIDNGIDNNITSYHK